jgi:DNA polymerase III delta prime subunit
LRGELLILGSPGSGKTTMLLELARTLIERAQQEETHPIPVVFNLSSWAEKQPPLADWLVEELNARYDVPRKVGQAWIDHDQVLPLLDGLDEVRQDARDACVAAINAYRKEHDMVGMVVCSRVADYAALTAKLKLRGAIMVQPLTPEQVATYFARLQANTTAMQMAYDRLWRDAVENDDTTEQQLLKTPLMLSIITLTYAEQVAAPVDSLSIRDLFSTYVEEMLKRRGKSTDYTPEQTKHWLSWLAGRMVEHGQIVFYLEEMQPDWLKKQRWLYHLLVGMVGGQGSIRLTETLRWSWRKARDNLVGGLRSFYFEVLLFGLYSGLALGIEYETVFGVVVGVAGAVVGLVVAVVVGAVVGGLVRNELSTKGSGRS